MTTSKPKGAISTHVICCFYGNNKTKLVLFYVQLRFGYNNVLERCYCLRPNNSGDLYSKGEYCYFPPVTL